MEAPSREIRLPAPEPPSGPLPREARRSSRRALAAVGLWARTGAGRGRPRGGGTRGIRSGPVHLTIELEAATTKVEDGCFFGLSSDGIGKMVQMLAPVLLDLEQAGFAQDPQVLRHVVRRRADALCDLADVERLVDQQCDDSYPGVFSQRFQCDHTVVAREVTDDGEP